MELEYIDVVAPSGVDVEVEHVGDEWRWTIANHAPAPVAVDRVQLRWRLPARGPRRARLNGYQSWSESGDVALDTHVDPSLGEGPGLWRAMHHADDSVATPGEFRSELVTMLSDDDDALCVGFEGGARHDGTIRVRDGMVIAEAYLGGAVLRPGDTRELHAVRLLKGLDQWATWAGSASAARASAPFVAGWCSWYHYFHDISEDALRANLARASALPIDVFQLDDGYQAAIGDWLERAATFPSPLERLAADIAIAGYRPGIWIAPFLASPTSRVAAAHPDWIVRRPSGRPMIGMVNAGWGGEQYVLDTTHPAVVDHLERLAAELVAMGWTYLKLDFTYAPSFTGQWYDPSLTPAERVRAGYDAIRRGAGDDAFILGCGAPLGPCIGAVDGMRIGPDVAPHWEARDGGHPYAATAPATVNALRNTRARQFMHRRLWVNDPDCVMLRTTDTELTPQQIDTWADAVAASGGMVLISDDLSLLDHAARRRFAEVVAAGRAADEARRTEPHQS